MSQSKILNRIFVSEDKKNELETKQDLSQEMDFFGLVENVDVPSVILAEIFVYLNKKDLMNCKLVCKHWLMVLMTDVYLKRERHLFLNHCVLKENCEPLSLFANAPYGYRKLTVGSDVVFGADNEICWEYFGDNIDYLDIAEKKTITAQKYVKMLTSMPFIKILRVHNDGPIYAGMFGRAMELLADQEIELNLEELRIECVNCNPISNEYFDVLPKIVNVAPKLKKIHIESIKEKLVPVLDGIVEEFPQVMIVINLKAHSDKFLSWLLDTEMHKKKNIIIDHLEFSYENCKSETLDSYMTHFPSIKGINLESNSLPSVELYDKIEKLSLNMRNITNYSCIEGLSKLTDVAFLDIINCMEVHTAICHPKVTKLKIQINFRFNCRDCLNAILMGFPNIEEFSLQYGGLDNETLAIVLKTMSSYENLKIFCFNETELRLREIKAALELIPQDFTLPIMDLKIKVSEITDEVALRLCQIFSRVKYLSLEVTGIEGGSASLIRTILANMPVLKHVEFDFNRCTDAEKLIDIQEVFVECGQSLKTISLPFMSLKEEKSEQMLLSMPNLHLITLKGIILTRIEKDQLHSKKLQIKTPIPTNSWDNGDSERRHNHNFINRTRERRHVIHFHRQFFSANRNISPREANRRLLMYYRRYERDDMMRRDLED